MDTTSICLYWPEASCPCHAQSSFTHYTLYFPMPYVPPLPSPPPPQAGETPPWECTYSGQHWRVSRSTRILLLCSLWLCATMGIALYRYVYPHKLKKFNDLKCTKITVVYRKKHDKGNLWEGTVDTISRVNCDCMTFVECKLSTSLKPLPPFHVVLCLRLQPASFDPSLQFLPNIPCAP